MADNFPIPTYWDLVDEIDNHEVNLSKWESDFIVNLFNIREESGVAYPPLTGKQKSKVSQIHREKVQHGG